MAGLGVEHLEWQERSGSNTTGVLKAHLVAVEIGWFYVGCAGLSYQDHTTRVISETEEISAAADTVGVVSGRTAPARVAMSRTEHGPATRGALISGGGTTVDRGGASRACGQQNRFGVWEEFEYQTAARPRV